MKTQNLELAAQQPDDGFVATVVGFRGGCSARELDDNLRNLISAVRETGKGGKLIYEIVVKPAATGNKTIVITDKITPKAPVLPRDNAIYYATQDNGLVRDNPDQANLPVKEVVREPVAVKTVGQ